MSDGNHVIRSEQTTETKTYIENGVTYEVTTTTTTDYKADGTTTISKQVKKERNGQRQSTTKSSKPMTLVPIDPKTCNIPKAPVTTDRQWIHEALEEHNVLRAKHNSPPLELSEDLCQIAQAWVNKLTTDIGKMEHSMCGLGENVYWNTEKFDGKRPPDTWYSEIKHFNWNKMEKQSGTGHFTQVIWKNSKEFGIAMAKLEGRDKRRNGYYVVANYNPPGNVMGRYSENLEKAAS